MHVKEPYYYYYYYYHHRRRRRHKIRTVGIRGLILVPGQNALIVRMLFIFNLKMEVRSSETSVNFYQTTRRHTSADGNLHGHCRENLKYRKQSTSFGSLLDRRVNQ
jgi:hypothetical protein